MFKIKNNTLLKKIIFAVIILILFGAGLIWYIFNEKFTDTTEVKSNFSINALDLIKEFSQNDSLSNKKYAEKILVVTGMVSQIEAADSTVNIKMSDTTSGSYVIFAFQQQHTKDAKTLNVGDKVSIKGSCSGGAYSQILETEFITFKRCAINK